MSARDINLDYGEDGRTLQQANLAGQSDIQLAGAVSVSAVSMNDWRCNSFW